MTPTARISASELRKLPGSNRAHQSLQDAVLGWLELNGVPAVPVHTGPRVTPRPGGGFDLRKNTAQHGLADVMACLPPDGRLALIELKTGRAYRSPAQKRLHERFTAAGALCLVVRDLLELARIIHARRVQPHHGGTR